MDKTVRYFAFVPIGVKVLDAWALIKYETNGGAMTYLYDKLTHQWIRYPDGFRYVNGFVDNGIEVTSTIAYDLIKKWTNEETDDKII
jgi:hypothetical protein